MSRKLRPRKLRPQTRKTQTLGCLENSDLEKTQTLGCLENSDPKNSDPWMSRKLRPEKLRPSGCLENSDPKSKTYLHRVNAASRLVLILFVDTVALPQSAEKRKTVHSVMKIICRERKKQLAVFDTCNDHENYTQHSYRFFFSLSYKPSLNPQRVVSLEAIREVCCVMVSCANTGPASRDSSGYNLYTSRNSRDLVNHTVSTFKRFIERKDSK